ncbi:hypothetical protein MHLP_03720 [Candidatus Mycoplasma haematolamae str. Purdue]|uniref:Uncharacterized protein n=1 Tax=Mycoplasma haematolamae (strain Purdue) TaxID=1212765 RepID=I7CKA1_MYCHA|nr:hypothetical protein MHLP_03720 [Candidatus Mycoplasma haematolamae str. Purdue]
MTFLGDKVTKAKSTYTTVKGYTTSSWDFLKKNWFTLWLFLRSSYREIDLKKLYEWLSSPKISKTITESKGKWDTVMSKFQSLASHSGKIGFNVAKPYQKIFREFMSNPDNLPTWLGLVGKRLNILDSYLEDKTQNDLSNVNVMIDFFSSSEDNIKKLEYNRSGR